MSGSNQIRRERGAGGPEALSLNCSACMFIGEGVGGCFGDLAHGGMSVIPTSQSQLSSLLRSEQKDQSGENLLISRIFFSRVCTHHAGFTHLWKRSSPCYSQSGPCSPPSQSPCWPLMTQPMLPPPPRTGLDISRRQQRRSPFQLAGPTVTLMTP